MGSLEGERGVFKENTPFPLQTTPYPQNLYVTIIKQRR